MKEKIQVNENMTDQNHSYLNQQALLRDIDYCFGILLKRLKDEEAEGYEPAEIDFMGDIYEAFDTAISIDDKSQLIALLHRQVSIPHEFSILLADVIEGKFKPRGRPKKLTISSEIYWYIEMCKYQSSKEKTTHANMLVDFSERLLGEDFEVSTDTLELVWKKGEADPWLKEKFGVKG